MVLVPTPDRRFIAIEGLPGSGHTEFVEWVSDQPDWFAELEREFSALPPIDRSPLSHALQRLVGRFESHQSLVSEDLFRSRLICDFTFETHALWAECLLSSQELALYNRVAAVMTPSPVRADVVVYIQAPEAEILATLKQQYKGVDVDQWRRLYRAYDSHFFSYDETPVLVVRRDKSGAYHGLGSREAVWDKILSYQGGKTYFLGESGLWDGGSPAGD